MSNFRVLIILFVFLLIVTPISTANITKINNIDGSQESFLPPPLSINISIEHLLHRRTCIRSFSDQPVSDEHLSTVLWSALGYINETKRTVNPINGILAVKIYVIKEDGVFCYDPVNHSLIFHKQGDYRGIAQYWAPVLLGIVWDRSQNRNEKITGSQIGEICQNIILCSSALGLGTVPTNDFISALLNIDLPIGEDGRLVMPLGHPKKPTIWKHSPIYFSLLPRIKDSNTKLSELIVNMSITESFDNKELSRQNISQLLWACYGYSYYKEVSSNKSLFGQRHRTVPSGHGYYPLDTYAVTSKGIYQYIPGLIHMDRYGIPIISYLRKTRLGDYRKQIAECSNTFVENASFSIIQVINLKHTEQRGLRHDDFSALEYRWLWYYEAGACAQNTLLEAEAWGLKGNIVEIKNKEKICNLLRLNDEFEPTFVLPIGYLK